MPGSAPGRRSGARRARRDRARAGWSASRSRTSTAITRGRACGSPGASGCRCSRRPGPGARSRRGASGSTRHRALGLAHQRGARAVHRARGDRSAHDAAEPLALAVHCADGERVGVAYDLGRADRGRPLPAPRPDRRGARGEPRRAAAPHLRLSAVGAATDRQLDRPPLQSGGRGAARRDLSRGAGPGGAGPSEREVERSGGGAEGDRARTRAGAVRRGAARGGAGPATAAAGSAEARSLSSFRLA